MIVCGNTTYRIPITAHADDTPLLVCDRPVVNFGGAPVDNPVYV